VEELEQATREEEEKRRRLACLRKEKARAMTANNDKNETSDGLICIAANTVMFRVDTTYYEPASRPFCWLMAAAAAASYRQYVCKSLQQSPYYILCVRTEREQSE